MALNARQRSFLAAGADYCAARALRRELATARLEGDVTSSDEQAPVAGLAKALEAAALAELRALAVEPAAAGQLPLNQAAKPQGPNKR
jgi:hypothetical protein